MQHDHVFSTYEAAVAWLDDHSDTEDDDAYDAPSTCPAALSTTRISHHRLSEPANSGCSREAEPLDKSGGASPGKIDMASSQSRGTVSSQSEDEAPTPARPHHSPQVLVFPRNTYTRITPPPYAIVPDS
jgi:hypothetical protein